MFRLFRGLRQTLLSENKITKYLLYALGEIILVVIGILIALSINNRNQRFQDQKKAQKFMQEIRQNIILDIRLIDNILDFNAVKSRNLITAIDYYYRQEQDIHYRDSLLNLFDVGNIAQLRTFKSNRTGIDALVGSGELDLLPDTIRILLNEYYEAALDEDSNNERITILTREAIQNKLGKEIIRRIDIAQMVPLDPQSLTESDNSKIQVSNDLPMDMLLLSVVEQDRSSSLTLLRRRGEYIMQVIDAH